MTSNKLPSADLEQIVGVMPFPRYVPELDFFRIYMIQPRFAQYPQYQTKNVQYLSGMQYR